MPERSPSGTPGPRRCVVPGPLALCDEKEAATDDR